MYGSSICNQTDLLDHGPHSEVDTDNESTISAISSNTRSHGDVGDGDNLVQFIGTREDLPVGTRPQRNNEAVLSSNRSREEMNRSRASTSEMDHSLDDHMQSNSLFQSELMTPTILIDTAIETLPANSNQYLWRLPVTQRYRRRPREVVRGRMKMETMFQDFLQSKSNDIETEFQTYLREKNYFSIHGEALHFARQLIIESRSPFYELGLYNVNTLPVEDKLALLRWTTKRIGFRYVCFPWILAMIKHSILGFGVCELYILRTYGPHALNLEEIDSELKEKSRRYLFFLTFFTRMMNFIEADPIQHVSPVLACPYCGVVGVHFANECHVLHTQDMKDRHLDGYCNKCTDGRDCDGVLHEYGLTCQCGVKPAHAPEMCRTETAVCGNSNKINNLRKVFICFKGWKTVRLNKLFLALLHWYKLHPESPNALQLKLVSQYANYQSYFRTSARMVKKIV